MTFDILIRNALVVDGSGAAPYLADVGVEGDRVGAIGNLNGAEATTCIDGSHKVLCPGFIDVHSHADLSIHLEEHPALLEPLVRQGITTFVGGNCGMALAPLNGQHDAPILQFFEAFTGRDQRPGIRWRSFAEYLDAIEKQGVVLNTAMLAPHGIIRLNVMGQARRPARAAEADAMGRMLEECLEAGALGLSTGLQYFPGSQSDTEELIGLGRVLRKHDAVFTSHLRSYSNTLELAIREVEEISRTAGIRAQISHLFWVPHVNDIIDPWVRRAARLGSRIYRRFKFPIPLDAAVAKLLERLGREIERGLPLGIDGMPTAAGFTHLLAFFPPWVLEDDMQTVLSRIGDPETRRQIWTDIKQGQSIWPHRERRTWSMNFMKLMGWRGVYIMSVPGERNKHLEGMNLAEVGKERGVHPFDAACDLLLEENGRVLVFETFTRPNDDFVERSLLATMKDPNVSIASDAILLGYGRPSHLFYDCYPKFIARYIRDNRTLSLAEGIRKCTSLPARQLGISERGRIERGNYADLVLFDYECIDTYSTFEKPDVSPSGIENVIINGRVVVDHNGYHPEPLSGRVIRRF